MNILSTGIAHAVIAGNLTRDPELNASGKVLVLGVAVNKREKDKDGEYGEVVHFFDVKVLGGRAEPLSKIISKGERVTVEGDLVQERWETDEGQKRSVVRILAREVVLGGGSKPAASSDDSADENGPGW